MATDAVTLYASLLRGELDGDDALHAAHRMLLLVMDSIPQAIFWKDRSSSYLGCNRVFASLAGLEPGELIGKTDLEMPWASYEARDYRGWDQRVMESGEPVFGIVEQIHRRDGTALRIETNKIPLIDDAGNVFGVLGTFEDVTDQLKAQEELREHMAALDERVQRRTSELSRANEILRREVDERVRLQAEERQQRAYADALRETAAAIARSLDLDYVLEETLVGVERLMSHDLGAVILLGDNNTPEVAHYRARFGYGSEGVETELDKLDLDPTITDAFANADEPIVMVDLHTESGGRGLCAEAGSVIVAPMKLGHQLIGYLVAESATPGFFSESHAERLRAVADQAAAALSNARLFHHAAQIAAGDERQRLARDLHDSVSQSLWTASLLSGSLAAQGFDDPDTQKQVETVRVLTKGALAEMRTLLLELRPAALEEASLDELLRQLIEAFDSRNLATVKTRISQVDSISTDVKLGLYRVAQEALNNISRHADAEHVHLELLARARSIELTIVDDGEGFEATGPTERLGLAIMYERCEAIDGTLEVQSTPGLGTTIKATIPLGGAW